MEQSDYGIIRTKYHMSWGEYLRHLYNMSKMIEDRCPFYTKWQGVYGPPRGGSIIAVYLSHQLGIPFIKEMPKRMSKYTLETCIVVDDICDSGKALAPYDTVFTATICARPNAKHMPNLVLFETDQWMVFPYERD